MTRKEYDEKMKKLFKVVLVSCILLNIATIALIKYYKPSDIFIDLSAFGGRVIPQENVKPGTFTVEVPYHEAIAWGHSAIMSYGPLGFEIWEPDKSTSGVFQHYGNKLATTFYYYEIQYVGKTVTLRGKTSLVTYPLNLFLVVITCLAVWAVTSKIMEGEISDKKGC